MKNPIWRRISGLDELLGQRICPWWMGPAYRYWDRDAAVFAAMPLNKLLSWWVSGVDWCRKYRPGYWERRMRGAHHQGFRTQHARHQRSVANFERRIEQARQQGLREGWNRAHKDLLAQIDKGD